MAMGRLVHLVPDHLEKFPGSFGIGIVVNTGGVNFQHLAPEELFRGPDIPDAGQQLIEIISSTRLFEPFVVQGEPLDDIFPQSLGGPLPEPGGDVAFDPVSNGDNGVRIVEFKVSLDLAGAFGLNL